jgi:hypothetical protein
LKRAHINKVGEVLEMSDDDLLKIRNFGVKSLEELREKLTERGIASYPKDSDELADSDSPPTEPLSPIGLTNRSEDFRDLVGSDNDLDLDQDEEDSF